MIQLTIQENVTLQKNHFETMEELFLELSHKYSKVDIVEMADNEIPTDVKESLQEYQKSDKKIMDFRI